MPAMAATLVRRVLLVSVALVVVAVLLVAYLVRRALDPETLRPMAEQQLSALLHVPVRIGALDLKVWPSPVLDGRDIDVGRQSNNAPPSLSVGGVHIVPVVSSLFSSTIVIEKVEIRNPRLNVLRDADGRWALPGPTHVEVGPRPAPPAPGPAASAPGSAAPATDGPGGPRGASPGPSIEVRSFTLVDGTVAVYDVGQSTPAVTIDALAAALQGDARSVSLRQIAARLGESRLSGAGTIGPANTALSLSWDGLKPEDMPKVFALLGVPPRPGVIVEGEKPLSVELSRKGGTLDVTGTLAASRIVLPPLTLTGFESPFVYGSDEFTFSPLRFAAYRGAFTGRVGAAPGATPPTWGVDGTLEHIDIGEALAATTSLGRQFGGIGRVRLAVRGRRDLPVTTSAAGTVGLSLTSGVIRDFPLLASVNQALGITEGSGRDTNFDRLGATFTLASGTAATRDLQLVAGALTVNASGTIGLDSHALDLTGTARFTREKSRELSQISPHVSGAKNANGEVEIPLTVRGTLQAPAVQVQVGKILENAARKEIERGIRRGLDKLLKP
jgi:uncharacterized protein involved in outer membrane biogenesis